MMIIRYLGPRGLGLIPPTGNPAELNTGSHIPLNPKAYALPGHQTTYRFKDLSL